MTAAGWGFAAALALIMFQVPIALALGLVGFAGYVLLNGLTPAISMVVAATRDSTLVYSMIVLPLFVLMGNLVAGAGISNDLFRAAQALIGRRRGGLAMATVIASGAFGAVCGSSVATAATIGKVAIPSMRRLGYADSLSTGAVAAGGTLGILIPPSVIMVVYGVATQTHIGMLFAAGLLPGVVGILGYMLAVQWTVWRNPATVPDVETLPREPLWPLLRVLWPVIVIFGVVMGGVYGGLFTSVEASGIGASAALLFVMTRRALTRGAVYRILVDSANTSAMMFAIILGAAMFSEFINQTGVHHGVLALVQGEGIPPAGVIALILLVYLVMGCVLESLSMVLLTIPVFFPIIKALGFDPVWFGIVIVVAVEIGLITPPIGVNLFVIRSVVPGVPMRSVIEGVMPFVVVDLFRIVLIASVPSLSLWLPYLLFKNPT